MQGGRATLPRGCGIPCASLPTGATGRRRTRRGASLPQALRGDKAGEPRSRVAVEFHADATGRGGTRRSASLPRGATIGNRTRSFANQSGQSKPPKREVIAKPGRARCPQRAAAGWGQPALPNSRGFAITSSIFYAMRNGVHAPILTSWRTNRLAMAECNVQVSRSAIFF